MKVCILGNGLTSLALAKALVNKGISTDVFLSNNNKKKDKSRTLGISKSNIEFFNKNILNIEKFLWDINKIEIYSENLNNKKIIDFNDKKRLFLFIKSLINIWSGQRGSNPRPSRWQRDALPLSYARNNIIIISHFF